MKCKNVLIAECGNVHCTVEIRISNVWCGKFMDLALARQFFFTIQTAANYAKIPQVTIPPPPLPLSSSCPPTPTTPLLSPPTILFLHGRAVWDTHADILHEMCRNFAHQKSRHMLNLSDNRPTKAGHRNVNVREKIAQYLANANYIFLVHTVCTKQDILYSPPISNCNIQGRLANIR